MTTEEALKIATDPKRFSRHAVVGHALTVLADALREAQAQTVQMREDAARVADGVRNGPLPPGAFATAVRISNAIRALPAPGEVVAVSTFSPAPAVAPVAQKHDLPECDDCDGKGGFDGYGKPSDHPSALRACESCDGTGRVAPVAAPKPVAFDAEAALMEMALKLNESISAGHHPVTCDNMLTAIEAGLAAGRGAK